MPPPALLAHEMLRLPGQTSVAWAEFDPDWYRRVYANVTAPIVDADDAAVLQFYLEHGQQLGHSPNLWFDEAWHLRTYAGSAAAVRDGHAQSAFDTYCHEGFRHRSPHWLFNEVFYRRSHTDLSDVVLEHDGSVNGYDHFLKQGSREGRIGHPLFDPTFYQAQLDAAEREAAEAVGAYCHYLQHIAQSRQEIRTSIYFDPHWYLRKYPEAGEAIAAGKWLCALHHYLANATPAEFDPLPEFSEQYYLAHNQDVAATVGADGNRNGYEHFVGHGALERRAPNAAIDLKYYTTAHRQVRNDLESGRFADGFVHYLLIGRDKGLPTLPPIELAITEQLASAVHQQRADVRLPASSHTVLDFEYADKPAVSVILVLRDQFALTLLTLSALRASYPGAIELILIDAGSTDDTSRISRFVRGAQVLRFGTDLIFLRAANAATHCATAGTVLFLDNAAEMAPGALAAALRRLQSDPSIGAVGAKLLRAHGRLQAAGSIVWRDGSTQDYGRDMSPQAPEANFVRDVDFCSIAFLLLRTDLLRQLEGFDEAFIDNNLSAADLCLRIAAAGSRVVFEPAALVTRLLPLATDARPDADRQMLLGKHDERLRNHQAPAAGAAVFARSPPTGRRVLFIDDMIPLRRLGSGFVRSNDLINAMAALGYAVTVFPMNLTRFGLATIHADMPDVVEVMHDRSSETLATFLAERPDYYDVIWIARTHNLDRVGPLLERLVTDSNKPPQIVLDTEAITALRDAQYSMLSGDPSFDVDTALLREFANLHLSQNVVAVNSFEAAKLRTLGPANVTVIGHLRELRPTPRGFEQRAGMLFLGAIHEVGSPNHDALEWFVREVLPFVEQALGWETRLTVAGYVSPDVSLATYRDHPRITLRGPVEELEPLYGAHRIFVAPTRYAAGVPYKLHEAASYGLPVIATDLLCRQLGWDNGRDIIAVDPADPAGFARQIVALYRDAALWQSLRDHALERARTENARIDYEAAVRQVLDQHRE